MAYVAIIIVTLFVVTNLPRILAGAHEVTNTHLIIFCIENKQVLLYHRTSESILSSIFKISSSMYKPINRLIWLPKKCRFSLIDLSGTILL